MFTALHLSYGLYVHVHTHINYLSVEETQWLQRCQFVKSLISANVVKTRFRLIVVTHRLAIFIVAVSPAHCCWIYAEPSPWRSGVVALISLVGLQFTLGLLLATLFPRWLQLGVEIAGVLTLLAVRANCGGDATAFFSPCSQYVVIFPFPWKKTKIMYRRLLKE